MTTNGFITLPTTVPVLLAQATADAERARLEEIARGWRYYDGDTPKPLKLREREADDNTKVNVVQLAVDAGVDFLWGDDIVFSLDDPTERAGGEDEGERLIRAVWETNAQMELLQDVAMNGAISGRPAILLHMPEGVDRVQADDPATHPRLRPVDPSTLSAVWDQDDHDRVLEYRITWNVLDDRGHPSRRRKRVVWVDDTRWLIIDEIERRGGRWDPWGPGETEWPYRIPPIVTCKNLPNPNEWWGRPDIGPDLLDQQDGINTVLSNARRVSRLHGHPKLWASGVGDGPIAGGPDEAIILPDEGSRIGMLTPPAVIDQHLSLYEALRDAFHAQARVPQVVAGRLDNAGELSGIALQLLYGPLVRKTGLKRRSYGGMVDRLNRLLLILAGMEERATVIPWPAVVPVDDLAAAETASAKQRAGVSKATTVAELGYDPDEEAAARAGEAESALEAQMRAFDRGAGGGGFGAGDRL